MVQRVATLHRLAATALLVLLGVSSAAAHPAPFSYLDLAIRDGRIDGTLVVHIIDAAHELGITPPDQLLDNAVAERERQRLATLLTPRISLRTDHRLVPQWTSLELLRDQAALKLTFTLPDERAGALTVDTNLFPYDPMHQTFVNIYEGDALRQQVIFNANAHEHTYYRGTREGALAVMRTFIPSGIRHILIGPDHILFLIGLLLLGGSRAALLAIVTAFTAGHSITLSLAALNIVTPPPTIIEPAIALSIVFVGADNLIKGMGRDLRTWVALVFGLVHGFGFAYVLREFGLPGEALGWSLFSFNLGVEIGQLLIVLMVSTALALLRRRSDVLGHRVAWAGSVLVMVAGAYWFVERVFFPAA